MLLNDILSETSKETGPKFTGYWKAKDAGTPGKKMVGAAEAKNQSMGAKTWIEPELLNTLALKRIHDKEADALKPQKKTSSTKQAFLTVYAIAIPLESVEHYIKTNDTEYALSKATKWQMNKMPTKFREIVAKDPKWKDIVLKIWEQAKIIYKGKQMPQPKKEFSWSKDVPAIKLAGGNPELNQKLVRELNILIDGYRKKYGIDKDGLRLPGHSPMESSVTEESNPTDVISVDVPLFLRLMEYAKEDAKTDMDLHDVTERAVEAMKQGGHLSMEHYHALVGSEATGGEKSVEEFKDTAKYGDDNSQNINQEIFQLLKSGATVFSNAAGRMGEIVSANNDGVTIKTKRGKGFTSFNIGDKVKIEKVEGRPNHYHVVNVMNEGKIKGKDGKACWKGYRYAGTENGKDKCVPVKKGK